MGQRLAADLVVSLHLLFIVFVVFGGLLVARYRFFLAIHLPAAIWGFLVEACGWWCPLTTLENHLRRQAGQAGYGEGFIERYLLAVMYPSGLTREMQVGLAVAVLLINSAIYGWIFLGPRRVRQGSGRR